MTVTRGFYGRHDPRAVDLPPGQHLTSDFPVLSTGSAHNEPTSSWAFSITSPGGGNHTWTWAEMMRLPADRVTADIHCVTRWSKLGTTWKGISLDVLFEYADSEYPYAMAHSYGGYTTNLPMVDLVGGKAWIAYEFDGRPLTAEHGGPARLLVPHLYFWKSAKWLKGITMMTTDEPGFWERNGYHNYGDPWREERHTDDRPGTDGRPRIPMARCDLDRHAPPITERPDLGVPSARLDTAPSRSAHPGTAHGSRRLHCAAPVFHRRAVYQGPRRDHCRLSSSW